MPLLNCIFLLKFNQVNSIFQTYKPFFIFLLKFFVSYAFLVFLYDLYLNKFDANKNEVDGITYFVAENVNVLTNFFNWNGEMKLHDKEASVKMIFNEKYVSRIIEGCNAVSVMILFVAFIFAFSNRWKQTILYILFGIATIYILNILRITLLNYALFHHPSWKEVLHDVVFPLFIYGVVFVLWVIWVSKFSNYAKK